MPTNLTRFLVAQENTYKTALAEIKVGRKESHWMWFIFPQIDGLGRSEISKFYALTDIEEAKSYLENVVLSTRLREITNALLQLDTSDATSVFGRPDYKKLKSCMTLFSVVDSSENNVFKMVIDRFF